MPSLASQEQYKPQVFEYFKDKAFGSIANSQTIFPKPQGKGLPANETYTYLKMTHDIYVFNPEPILVGQGGFGHVYEVHSLKTAQTYVIKRQQLSRDNEQELEHESKVLLDLGLCQDSGKASQRSEHYIVMPQAGKSLTEHLSKASPFMSVHLAIKLCWAVHCLHEGLSSKTNTAYAHRDIKPRNITINNLGELCLIDMGAATPNPDNPPPDGKNTPLYYPNRPSLISETGQQLTMRQLDVFALKRTIYMPDEVLCSRGRKESAQTAMILSRPHLEAAKIFNYFDTDILRPDSEQVLASQCFQYSPLFLASALVLGYYDLGAMADLMLRTPELSYQVLGLYFYHQTPHPYVDRQIIKHRLNRILNEQPLQTIQELPFNQLSRFIKAGFTYELVTAFTKEQAPTLFPLLGTDSSPSIKQATVLLWRRGLRNLEALRHLNGNEELAKQIVLHCFNSQLNYSECNFKIAQAFKTSKESMLAARQAPHQQPLQAEQRRSSSVSESPYLLPRVAPRREGFFYGRAQQGSNNLGPLPPLYAKSTQAPTP